MSIILNNDVSKVKKGGRKAKRITMDVFKKELLAFIQKYNPQSMTIPINEEFIDEMGDERIDCPEIDEERLREEMTEEEYDAYRHNRLEIKED